MRTNGNKIVKIGTKVRYRSAFGFGNDVEATIVDIELCDHQHQKYGEIVSEVDVDNLYRCSITLDNGHWAYGYQVDEIIG